MNVHRIGDPNSAGAPVVGSLQTRVFVNGQIVAVDGSPVAGHGTGTHSNPITTSGSLRVYAGGFPVNRQGDPDSCGHIRVGGSPNVFVG